jgi:hypothetical protein
MTHAAQSPQRLVLLLSAMGVGAALPLGEGCGGPCPDIEPEPLYRILDNRPDWIEGSGRLETTDEAFVISYDTKDGSRWEVEYRRVPKSTR